MYYDDYEESYYDYDYDEANEEAIDIALDMADRYGFALEDAYRFALEKVDPDKVYVNYGVRQKYTDPYYHKIVANDKYAAGIKKELDEHKKLAAKPGYDYHYARASLIDRSRQDSRNYADAMKRSAALRKEQRAMIDGMHSRAVAKRTK